MNREDVILRMGNGVWVSDKKVPNGVGDASPGQRGRIFSRRTKRASKNRFDAVTPMQSELGLFRSTSLYFKERVRSSGQPLLRFPGDRPTATSGCPAGKRAASAGISPGFCRRPSGRNPLPEKNQQTSAPIHRARLPRGSRLALKSRGPCARVCTRFSHRLLAPHQRKSLGIFSSQNCIGFNATSDYAGGQWYRAFS